MFDKHGNHKLFQLHKFLQITPAFSQDKMYSSYKQEIKQFDASFLIFYSFFCKEEGEIEYFVFKTLMPNKYCSTYLQLHTH